MDKLTSARREILDMDSLAALHSPIHDMHPGCKFAAAVFYIACVVSFPKYALSALAVLVLLPLWGFRTAGLSVKLCFYRLRIVLPLVCCVGLINPFFDRTVMLRLFGLPITGGIISMLTLMMKGIFSLMMSYLLMATTSIDKLCAALRMARVPGILCSLLLLTFRYVGVLLDELEAMQESYHLRAPGQKGIHISAWGSFLGQLLLRTADRGAELYAAMQLRGFAGEFYYASVPSLRSSDVMDTVLFCACALVGRLFDIPAAIGGLFVR